MILKSRFITNITKSTEDRFRQAKISKVLLHLNDITTLLERHIGQFKGIWGVVAKNFFVGPGEELKYISEIFVTLTQL